MNGFIVQQQDKQLLLTPLWPLSFEQVLQCNIWFNDTNIRAGTLSYGADIVELTFSFAGEAFSFCFEDNSESFWVTADSANAAMLLSDLMKEFSQLRIA